MGIAAFFVSIGFLIWAVVDFFRGNTITGWASMMVSLWFIGGLLLLSVGIVGEYVGKIYLESKHRPRYIIESRTPDRIREREKGRSRKQEMPGENLRRSRAEARELQTSKRRVVSGAGLPTDLPKYVGESDILLAPIVSTAKSANVILKYWDKKYHRIPDLVVIEGPLAGGHLGFHEEQLETYGIDAGAEDYVKCRTSYEKEIIAIMQVIHTFSEKYGKKIPVAIGRS